MSVRLRNERRAEVVQAALGDVGIDPNHVYVNAFGDVMVSKPESIDPELLWRAYCIAYQAEPEGMEPICRLHFVAALTTRRVRCTTDVAPHCTSTEAFSPDCGSRSDSPVEVTP